MFKNSKIKFIEESHRYINTETGRDYISGTTFLGKYKPKFDADKMAYFTALKRSKLENRKVTKEEILNEWAASRDYSCERGSAFHLAMENFIKYGEVNEEYKKIIGNYSLVVSKHVSDIVKVFSEILFYIDEYEIAGTADICWEHSDGTFTIGDFKTNKQFRYYSPYNNWLHAPVSHLQECEFNNYTLQMSLYAYMCELLTGKKCRGLLILWLNKDTGKFEPIHCNYLKHEIIMLLRNYSKTLNTANES